MSETLNNNSQTGKELTQWDILMDNIERLGDNNNRAIDSRTGGFYQFDAYPRQKGESLEEYGARLSWMNKEAKGAADAAEKNAREKAYLKSEQGQDEQKINEKTKRIYDKIDKLVDDGKITQERAETLKAQHQKMAETEIAGLRQDYEDRQVVSTDEEEAAYQARLREMAQHGAEVGSTMEEDATAVAEATDMDHDTGETTIATEAEEKTRREEEDKALKEAEVAAREAEEARIKAETERQTDLQNEQDLIGEMSEAEIAESREKLLAELVKTEARIAELEQPLVAINADISKDEHDLAHDLAERDLNEEIAKSGLIKRLWKGTFLKKYYESKYTNQYMRGERTDKNNQTVHDLVSARSGSALKRFVLGATDEMGAIHSRYIHRNAGEELIEADPEVTQQIRSAIESYATAKKSGGENLQDLKRKFEEEIGRIKASANDTDKKIDPKLIDNYFIVAEQAYCRFEAGVSMDKVMEGFKVYDAKIRDGVRTEAHRDNIDKIVNKLANGNIGRFIPEEILAGAVGAAFALSQTGSRAIAGAAGGILVAGAFSGLKERNRITEDRARMLRDVANGLEYSGQDDSASANLKGHAKKVAKYEQRIGGTLYDIQHAGKLTSAIESALAMEDGNERDRALFCAVAEARVRTDFSDSEQKDLIAYSSEDKRGDERLALDRVLIRAEKILSQTHSEELEAARLCIQKSIEEGVSEKDKDFKKVRARMAMKKAGKTIAIGATTFLATQEITALFDPAKISIIEKAGLSFRANDDTASETLLASGFGLNRGKYTTNANISEEIRVSADDKAQIERLESSELNFKLTDTVPGATTTQTSVVEIDPMSSEAALQVKYDGWANNGTLASDGNELRAYIENGQFVSGMRGVSSMGGESLDYDSLAAAGQVKGYLTIGGAKFEIASSLNETGQLTWGENGVFTTTTGETVRAIGENGEKLYKYFEIAVDRGVDAEGIQHIVPFATDVGADSFNGVMTQITEIPVTTPDILVFTKTTETVSGIRDVFSGGIAVPVSARTGLGGVAGRQVESQSNTGPNQPSLKTTPPTQAILQPDLQEMPSNEQETQPISEPTSSEQVTSSPSEQDTSIASEQQEQDKKLSQLLQDNKEILGDKGVEILSSDAPQDEKNNEEYATWWGSLDEDKKNAVREIVAKIRGTIGRNNLKWGGGFRSWLDLNSLT